MEPDELELLRYENEILLGLMAGGYAYFLRQLMVGQQTPDGLSPSACEQTIVDALRRVQSTQMRFGYEYLTEIEAALSKMTKTLPLKLYLEVEQPNS
jgi:7-cyano-7-deazaguanine synthase in queuosine biosynthesis